MTCTSYNEVHYFVPNHILVLLTCFAPIHLMTLLLEVCSVTSGASRAGQGILQAWVYAC